MARREEFQPGDLVLTHKVMFEAAVVTRYGLVVGVRYPKPQAHMGCEERIDVLWHDQVNGPRMSTVCTCELFSVFELS